MRATPKLASESQLAATFAYECAMRGSAQLAYPCECASARLSAGVPLRVRFRPPLSWRSLASVRPPLSVKAPGFEGLDVARAVRDARWAQDGSGRTGSRRRRRRSLLSIETALIVLLLRATAHARCTT